MQKAIGELALIERIRSNWGSGVATATPSKPRGLTLGIGDDCAILRPPPGHELLVTTDFSLEGRHFRRDWHPPQSVGHRALARGLSDLAAMGARPLAAFLSLALPAEMLSSRSGLLWVERFFSGLNALANLSAVPLAGGDTAQSPDGLVLADIVLVGSAPIGRSLRRSTARPGDALYVTGALGGSAAELAAMEQRAIVHLSQRKTAVGATSIPRFMRNGWDTNSKSPRTQTPDPLATHPQMFPQPRLAVGQALLRRRLATAAIDLSDGLSTDLAHLCQQSGVGADLSAAMLPLHPLALQSPAESLPLALHGGEDYELLFSAPASTRMPRSIAGVRLTRIGTLVRGSAVSLVDSTGHRTPLQPGGWEHFTKKH